MNCLRRLRLGVGCMASFPVRDPVLFAYQWATLDLISEGRIKLNSLNCFFDLTSLDGEIFDERIIFSYQE